MCSYSGYWIVDLHLRDKDLFDINFVSYLFIYLLICLFVFMYLQHLFVLLNIVKFKLLGCFSLYLSSYARS